MNAADASNIASDNFSYFQQSPIDPSEYVSEISMSGLPGYYTDPDTATKMLDSLDSQAAFMVESGIAEAWQIMPGRITSASQELMGDNGIVEGQDATWRSYPDWDTTSYTYKWLVDGDVVGTGATYTTSFGSSGTHTIANVTIRADNSRDSVVLAIKAFDAAINGPTNVRPFATCTWYGSASDGSSPYSYGWTEPTSGSDQYYSFENGSNDGESFTLTLNVTDAGGYKIPLSETVHVSSSAPVCPDFRIGR